MSTWKEMPTEYRWLGEVARGGLVHYRSPNNAPWRPGNVLRYYDGDLYVICGCGEPIRLDARWKAVGVGEPDMSIEPSIWHRTEHCGWHFVLTKGKWHT